MRVVGSAIRRVVAESVLLDDGTVRRLSRTGMTRDHRTAFSTLKVVHPRGHGGPGQQDGTHRLGAGLAHGEVYRGLGQA